MTVATRDGTLFRLEPRADDESDYFEVFAGDGLLGTIRLRDCGKTDCWLKVPTANGYFTEIVQHLRD